MLLLNYNMIFICAISNILYLNLTTLFLLINSPADDFDRMKTNDLGIKPAPKFFSAIFQQFGICQDFNRSWLPRRQYIINNKCHSGMPTRVSPFFSLGDIMSTDLNCVCFGIVAKPNWNDMRVALHIHGGQTSQVLLTDICEFIFCEYAHTHYSFHSLYLLLPV